MVFRNVKHLSEQQIKTLFSGHAGVQQVSIIRTSEDGWVERVLVYFDKRENALGVLKKYKNTDIDGKKLYVVLREYARPAIQLEGLPEGSTVESVTDLLKRFHPVDVAVTGSRTVAYLNSPDDVQVAVPALHAYAWNGSRLQAQELAGSQVLTIESSEADAISATSLPQFFSGHAEQQAFHKGSRAVVGFRSRTAAVNALNAYLSSKVSLGASTPLASLSERPISTLEAHGLGADQSVSGLRELLQGSALNDRVLRTDRVALMKVAFRRSIVPAMKKLKTLTVDGQKLAVERYLPLPVSRMDDEYDRKGQAEEFDELAHRMMLDSSFAASRSERYQLLRNNFERALFDAKHSDEVGWLADDSLPKYLQQEARSLLDNLIQNKKEDSKAEVDRLFEIYVQCKDNLRFAKDFAEMETLSQFQAPMFSESEKVHWSQFPSGNPDDVEVFHRRLELLSRKAEEERIDGLMGRTPKKQTWDEFLEEEEALEKLRAERKEIEEAEAKKRKRELRKAKRAEMAELAELAKEEDAEDDDAFEIDSADSDAEDVEDDDEVEDDDDDDDYDDWEEVEEKVEDIKVEEERNEDDETLSMGSDSLSDSTDLGSDDSESDSGRLSSLDVDNLKGPDGFTWSGVILDSDVTQKSMPGNRVMSHRALVMVGNMRGTGGYGVGKAKGPKEAVDAAFRAALKNLVHVDLYDKFGLAHDLHGKHNSCHAYIRATPRGRKLVGSDFAQSILLRMGIGSASVKLVGRRTPYSQVGAIFDALARHNNLDEYAKMTGKRYLTLRWAKRHGL